MRTGHTSARNGLLAAGIPLLMQLLSCAPITASVESHGAIAPESAKTYVFNCSDAFNFVARTGEGQVWLFLPGNTVRYQQLKDGRYSDGESMFEINGEISTLETAEGRHLECVNDRRSAIWEHAKLNGADFRAVGNEPGWNLEIRHQSMIALATNYGMDQYEFELPEAETDTTARTTRYKVVQDGHELLISLSGKPCRDVMSGESFETTVEVIFDGQVLTGCGRALH